LTDLAQCSHEIAVHALLPANVGRESQEQIVVLLALFASQ